MTNHFQTAPKAFPRLKAGLQVWYVRAQGCIFGSAAILCILKNSSAILAIPAILSTIPAILRASNPSHPQPSQPSCEQAIPAILSNPSHPVNMQSQPSSAIPAILC